MIDTPTALAIISLVSVVAPVATAVTCFFMWRKNLARPGLFLLVSVLTMFGLRGVLDRISYALRMFAAYLDPVRFLPDDGVKGVLLSEVVNVLVVAAFAIILGVVLLRAAMHVQTRR